MKASLHVVDAYTGPELDVIMDQLQRLALTAIRSGAEGTDNVLGFYETALQRYAAVWIGVVGSFSKEYSDPGLTWSRSPLGTVRLSVGRLIQASPVAPSVDDVYSIAYFPMRMAQRAIEWNAPAYLQLLDLYPLMYRVGRDSPGPSDATRVALTDRSWRHLVEGLGLVLPAMERPNTGPVDVESIAAARVAIRKNLTAVLESAIEFRDLATFATVLKRWRAAERRI
jgi:hypothetical protein